MNKLPKKTATSLTLAVSCVLPIMAVGAEASPLDLSIDGSKGSPYNLGLSASPMNLPALNALGLTAAAPTVEMAKTARFSPSRLVPSFTNQANARNQTQAANRLPAIAPSVPLQPTMAPTLGDRERPMPTAALALATIDLETTTLETIKLETPEPKTVALETVAPETSGLAVIALEPAAIPTVAAPLGQVMPLEVAQAPSNSSPPLSDQEIREQLLTTPNTAEAPNLDVLDRRPQPVPSSTFITPNAYGADWGDFYIGTAGATEDTKDGLDGSASVGMGFGNAVDNVGVELNVGIISIDGFADDGTVGFKVHKIFPQANNLGVAVGWYNPISWGAAKEDEDTFYGVVTQRFDLRPRKANSMPLTTSVGVGTGAFRSKGAVEAGDNAPNLFGSVGLRVIPQVSLVSSWSGRALGLAASAAPFENLPVVFTAGVSDLTDNTDAGTQFVGGLGYSFGF